MNTDTKIPTDNDNYIYSSSGLSIINISPETYVGAPLSTVKNLPDSAEWTGTYSLEIFPQKPRGEIITDEPITLKINFKKSKIHATAILKLDMDRTLTLDADFNSEKRILEGQFDVSTAPPINGRVAGKIGDESVFIMLHGKDSDGTEYSGMIDIKNPANSS